MNSFIVVLSSIVVAVILWFCCIIHYISSIFSDVNRHNCLLVSVPCRCDLLYIFLLIFPSVYIAILFALNQHYFCSVFPL